jgi:hypothetical protein
MFNQYDMNKSDREKLANTRKHYLEDIKVLESSDEDGGE